MDNRHYLLLALFTTLLFLGQATEVLSQDYGKAKVIPAKVDVTHAEFLGTTPPIRDLVPIKTTSAQRQSLAKRNRKPPKDFAGRERIPVLNPELEHQGPDQIRQTSINPSNGFDVEPLVNIMGLTVGGSPHDPSGDIGLDHYMQAINATTIGIYDKEGNQLSTFTGNTLWSSIGFSSFGDPIIMYDQEVNRWIITEFPPSSQLLIAISETSDPMGSYSAYSFATPSFPDYPKYGIWNNAYTVTTNEDGAGSLTCYLIDRTALLAGDASPAMQRIELPGNNNTEAGFFVATPVDWTGSTPPSSDPIFMAINDSSWGNVADDLVDIYTVNVDFENSNNTVIEETQVPLSPFDGYPCSSTGPGFACIPQSGGNGLDGIPEVIMHQAHYRNFGSHEAMIFNFITDATDGDNISGIRWVEMRRTGGDWFLYQEGTFAPDDGLDRFMAGICMDGAGNIGLAYNVSSADSFVGVRFTGRRASDPLGEMTVNEYTIVEGTNSISSGGRFGDYGHMSVDPVNDRTFWYTTEYASSVGGGDVDTRIIAFELRRDTIDIGPSAVISPQDSPDLTDNEIVSFEVTNFGLETQEVFEIGYIFKNGTAVIEPVNFTLIPDSVYNHTFASTVDMSAIGPYDFKFFTSLATDLGVGNDTIRAVISKLSRNDAGISGVNGLEGSNCVEAIPAEIILKNFGTEMLTSVTINVILNGAAFETINWTGNLAPDETATVAVNLTGFINGTNMISVTTANPNGVVDEIMANDNFLRSFNAILDGVSIFLNLTTDFYPQEIGWTLSDQSGNVLYESGSISAQNDLVIEEWCLDSEQCYTFAITDSYGDGICCGGSGNGNYNITNAEGNLLLISDGQYGNGEANDFCANFSCNIQADVNVNNESAIGANNGTILIAPMNGIGPYLYSIDGGQTFDSAIPFQNGAAFTSLAGGEYALFIQDAAGCVYEETIVVETICQLALTVEITNVSANSASDGSILINAISGNTPYQYSIDNGQNFQDSNLFENLSSGTYSIVVADEQGCQVTETVTLDFETATVDFLQKYKIEVFPNPTEGIFRVNVSGFEQASVFLKLEIYDVTGKRIQQTTLGRYNNTFTGQLSLVHYPSGTYFVRFLNPDLNQLLKVVKE